MDIRFFLLLICFFVSGFAGLVYETAWTREFAFVFGTSELAVSAVLAAYMAGLALGAGIAAKLAPRLRRPVLAYGLLELAIGLAALAVPFGIRGVMGVYLGWLGGLDAPPETVALSTALFHLLATFVVLVPCTALMGATLPLLARHAVRNDDQIGPRIGLLYAINTAGAIAGTLVTAFVLLPGLGLRGSVYVGVASNLVVFAVAALLARRAVPAAPAADAVALESAWVLPAIAISGAVSFVYEVVWVRLLGFVLGGSTAAFATMLASFLIGIALGSALASRFARTRHVAAIGFAVAQLGTALASWGIFRLADRLPEIAGALGATPSQLGSGSLAAIGLMLPITLCIGATFPFAVRLHAPHAQAAARASARVYAWNTIGSIVGSIGAGFVLLPMFGFEGAVLVGVLANVALAVWAAVNETRARRPLIAIAVGIMAIVLLVPPTSPKNLFRYSALSNRTLSGELEFSAVGRSATVALVREQFGWRLLTNGLPESSIERPENPPDAFHPSQWLAMLPVLQRPESRSMLIIGLGGGNTAGAITPDLETVDVIELEPEVVEANRRIADRRIYGDPLADPRVSLMLGDARGALVLANRRYDAIVSQPSHPWTSGASHLYTREFFSLVAERLEPGGVFVQWIGLAFVDETLLRSMLATLNDVFPYVETYEPFNQALLFIASSEPLDVVASAGRAIAAAPDHFARIGVHRVEDVASVLVLDAAGTRSIGEGATRITDDHNLLASSAWRIGDARLNAKAISEALSGRDPLPSLVDSLDVGALIRALVRDGESERAARLMSGLAPGPDRRIAAGWLGYEIGESRRAARLFGRTLKEDPGATEARSGLLATAPEAFDSIEATPREVAFAAATRRRSEGDVPGIRELDSLLAEFGPDHLLNHEAIRLRVAWRLATGDSSDAEAALGLIDQLIPKGARSADYLTRAEAAALAGDFDSAWASLARFRDKWRPRGAADAAQMARARELARGLPETAESTAVMQALQPPRGGG